MGPSGRNSPGGRRRVRIAMVAYSNYETDPRLPRTAKAFTSQGYLVDVYCLAREKSDRSVRENGVRIFRLPLQRKRGRSVNYLVRYGAFFLWTTALMSIQHLRRRYDVVFVHNLPNFLVFSATIPRIAGAKVVLEIHDPAPELLSAIREDGPPPWLLRMTEVEERASLGFADSVITVSEPMRARLLAIRPSMPVSVVMNTPEIDGFRRPPAGEPMLPGQWLVYCGTIAYRHGLDLVVEALAKLTPEFPDLGLAIGGEGPEVDAVLALAADLGVADRVKFLGLVPTRDVPKLLAGATAGVSALREDDFGALVFSMKVPEYLAAGLPVICSRTRTMRDYFDEDELFFFTPGDVDDLARAIRELLGDLGEATTRPMRAQAKLDTLDWSRQSDVLVETIESLIGSA